MFNAFLEPCYPRGIGTNGNRVVAAVALPGTIPLASPKVTDYSIRRQQVALLSCKGEGGIPGRGKASVVGCFRGSYRWHATKGFHGNKGEPSGSGLACRVRQADKAREIRRPDGSQTGG